jgi:hypothetical protein
MVLELTVNRKLNALCISATMQVLGCDHKKGNILLQLQWKGLALMYKEFSVQSPEFPHFHSCVPLVNRFEYLKSIAKMLQTEEQTLVVTVSSCLVTPKTAEVCKVLQGGMIFIMQNHFLKWENLLCIMHENYIKK